MDPAYLGVLVMVGANKKNFKPTVTAIMERYYAKYRGKGGLEEGEVAQGTSGGKGGGTQLGARAGSGRGGLICDGNLSHPRCFCALPRGRHERGWRWSV